MKSGSKINQEMNQVWWTIDAISEPANPCFLQRVLANKMRFSETRRSENPLKNNQTEISYLKNLNGFDVKLSSNYSLMSKITDYGANIEVSGTF